MSQQVTISAASLKELADLLESASRVARGLSEGKSDRLPFPILDLRRPEQIAEADEWFWSDDWQQGEREVNDALKRGDYDEFKSGEELLADLHRHV